MEVKLLTKQEQMLFLALQKANETIKQLEADLTASINHIIILEQNQGVI